MNRERERSKERENGQKAEKKFSCSSCGGFQRGNITWSKIGHLLNCDIKVSEKFNFDP